MRDEIKLFPTCKNIFFSFTLTLPLINTRVPNFSLLFSMVKFPFSSLNFKTACFRETEISKSIISF